ncbi:centrin [Angomonas deanei]|nr:centrin [Angomonas deanei]EPY43809.1 centrin [Angomonas deanei]|eukprot:EPY30749.1 centrin [Angomonas deanei]
MVTEMDRGGVSSNLVLAEFEEIMRQKFFSENCEAEMELAFPLFTEGKSDFITLEDLRRVAEEVGEDMPEEILIEMLESADVLDHDHRISKEEFMKMVMPNRSKGKK